MRVSDEVLKARRWIIDDVVHDFVLEDVWALPITGGKDDFQSVVDLMQTLDFPDSASLPARLLWTARDVLGRVFRLGRISTGADEAGVWPPVPGTDERSLLGRVPAELRATSTDSHLADKPFRPLYVTDTELADEMSNRTVYGVMHLAWLEQDNGLFRAHMSVYVKPRGAVGKAYMAFIKPFRYAIVYPALMRYLDRRWTEHRGGTGR